MNQQFHFESKPAIEGSIIEGHNSKYQIIGHGSVIEKDSIQGKLPLNKIDNKIIDFINDVKNSTNFEYPIHDDFSEESPHICDESCTPLESEMEKYIDDVIDELELFSAENIKKWNKDKAYTVLGFYRPFHFYENWGIYIRATGQAYRTLRLKRMTEDDPLEYGRPSIEVCYLISKTFTYFHEFYHHKIESLALKFELTTRQPHYTNGFHCLYCKTFETDRCLEEAFAHTYAYFETYEKLYNLLPIMNMNGRQFRHFLRNLIIRNSPPGYSLAEKIISGHNRELAKNFEYYFFEALLKYCYKLNNGSDMQSIDDEGYWKNFKHATHPILFTDNEVTYVVDVDDFTNIKVRNFLGS